MDFVVAIVVRSDCDAKHFPGHHDQIEGLIQSLQMATGAYVLQGEVQFRL